LYVSQLPLHSRSPAHPFGGFVINFDVSTAGHRDNGDDEFCAVITAQKCAGGEICLHEAGFILESCHGDIVIFPSSKITHFNLHFEGIRASLVLHSDKSGKRCAENFNNWADHVN
jgi:hypothetical protein